MSRALSVLEEFVPSSSFNRETLMLDEGKVFNQKPWWEDGGGGDSAGGEIPAGTNLYNPDNSFAGTLLFIEGRLQIIKGGKIQPFRGGTYLIDAGGGKRWHAMIDMEGNVTKSATSSWPSGDGGDGSTYHPPAWRPGELEQRKEEAAAQREYWQGQIGVAQAGVPIDIANQLTDKYLAEIQAGHLSEAQATRLFQQSYDAYAAKFSRWQVQAQLQQERGIEQANLQMERIGVLQQQAEGTQQAHQARATERGRRGQTISQDILPSAMPGLQALNLPMLGQMPVTQVDLGKLFGPMAPLPTWPDVPEITLPQVPGAPPVPDFPMQPGAPIPQAPDIGAILAQALPNLT